MSEHALPPHSELAEQSVLGALLLDNTAWDRVADILAPEDFYFVDHRVVFNAVAALVNANRPADAVTVFERLKAERQTSETLNLRYLEALAMCVPSAGNARGHAEVVRAHARCRRLITVAGDLHAGAMAQGKGFGGVQELVDHTITKLMDEQGATSEHEPRLLDELLPAFMDHVSDLYHSETSGALETGLAGVDDMLDGGLRPGDLMVLGARPSMGKTSLVLTICRHTAKGAPVLMCTLEDMLIGQTRRLVAAAGGINLADLRNPKKAPESMWNALTDAVESLRGLSLYLDDEPALTVMDVRRKVQQVKRRAGSIGLVVVDYLQLMDGEGENRNQALGFVANRLRRYAKEFGVPILLLSQLSRKADERNGPPQMSDLRDSGDIESAARIVALLYREHVYNRKADPHYAQLVIAKHNDGKTGEVHLYFDGPRLQYRDWDVTLHGPIPTTFGGRSSSSSSGLSA